MNVAQNDPHDLQRFVDAQAPVHVQVCAELAAGAVRDAVELGLEAGVSTLVLFHHDPQRTDEELDRLTDECRALVRTRGGTMQVLPAAEGLTLSV